MGVYKGYTDKQNKATQKYKKEKRDRIALEVPKGKKEEYKAFAESRGLSLTALIVKLLEEEMQK